MLRRIVRDPRNLPFVLSLISALLVIPELPSPSVRPTSGWRGWYVLLYRGNAAPVVEPALAAAAPGSVSRTAATVKIDAFSEIETLPVAAIDERLDPSDPRRDAWLSGVGAYFRAWDDGAGAFAAYVPATRGRLVVWFRLCRAFRAGGAPIGAWRLLEFDPFAMLSAPAAALAFSLSFAWFLSRNARRLPLAAAGALVWLPGLLNGGAADLCFSCTALYLWMPSLSGMEQQPIHRPLSRSGRTGVRIGLLLGIEAFVIASGGAGLYRVTRMAASMLSLGLLAELAAQVPPLRIVTRRAGHRFEPVPIVAPRKPAFVPITVALAALLLAAAPAGMSRLRVPLPHPVSIALAGSRWGIEAAARAGDAERLPGLADAVAHAALLQTTAFGPGYDSAVGPGTDSSPLPPREGRVRLGEYRHGSGTRSIVEAPRTVAQFDPGWLGRLVAGFRAGTVERLLLDQCRAVEVGVRAARTALLQAVPAVFAFMILLGAPLAGPASRRHLMRLGLWAITEPVRSRRTR